MKITTSRLKKIVREEIREMQGSSAELTKGLDILNQAAGLISDVALLARQDDDLKRHMQSMIDELHRKFGSHEDDNIPDQLHGDDLEI